MVGRDDVCAPVCELETISGWIELDGNAPVDHGDEMGVGDVIEYVAGDRAIDAAEEEVAVQGRFIGGDGLDRE